MDTLSVRLFVLAAEKLNISAAGRELGMAPAVASSRLAKLEQHLGADLLHRSTRKVSLSTEGAEFLPFAQEILAQEAAGRAALGLEHGDIRGTLRFACSSTFASLYIAPLLPDFLAAHPDINLDLKLSDTLFDLIEGSFDLALRNAALEDSSLKARKLASDERILCASPGYLERRGTPQSPDDLFEHDFVAFKDRAPRRLINADGDKFVYAPHETRCRIVVDDGLSQKAATVAGAGLSINSRWSAHTDLQNGTLVEVLPGYWLDDRSALWLVYPQSNVLTTKVRIFIDFLLKRLGESPPWS